MDLNSVENLANELMTKFDLFNQGWKFEFDRSKQRFGCCKHRVKKITLSKNITLLNSIEHVKDTILHEIAHALVGAYHHHNHIWKRKALEIGCNGERCYDSVTISTPERKYMYRCPNEDCRYIMYRYRKMKDRMACKRCCIKYNNGKYSEKYIFNQIFLTPEGGIPHED